MENRTLCRQLVDVRSLQPTIGNSATKRGYIVIAKIVGHDQDNIGGTLGNAIAGLGRPSVPGELPWWPDVVLVDRPVLDQCQ